MLGILIMITPISNIQLSTNFQGVKLKAPKNFKPTNKPTLTSKTPNKFSKFLDKTKNEFKNMDNETKDMLFDIIILSGVIVGFISVVAYHINLLVEKFQNIFP